MAVEDGKNGIISAYNAGLLVTFVKDMYIPDNSVLKMVTYNKNNLVEIIEIFEQMNS